MEAYQIVEIIKNPLFDKLVRAGFVIHFGYGLRRRLHQDFDRSIQGTGLSKQFGRPQHASHIGVVPASVHQTLIARSKRQIEVLLHRIAVDLRTNAYFGSTLSKFCHHTGSGYPALNSITEREKFFRQKIRRFMLGKTGLRNGMQCASPLGNLFLKKPGSLE